MLFEPVMLQESQWNCIFLYKSAANYKKIHHFSACKNVYVDIFFTNLKAISTLLLILQILFWNDCVQKYFRSYEWL